MAAPIEQLAGAHRLHVVAALCAFLAMLANVADVMLGFGDEMVTYGTRRAAEWFAVFERSLAVLATGMYISSNASVLYCSSHDGRSVQVLFSFRAELLSWYRYRYGVLRKVGA